MTKKDKVYMIKYISDVLHKKSRILQVYRIIDSNKDKLSPETSIGFNDQHELNRNDR